MSTLDEANRKRIGKLARRLLIELDTLRVNEAASSDDVLRALAVAVSSLEHPDKKLFFSTYRSIVREMPDEPQELH